MSRPGALCRYYIASIGRVLEHDPLCGGSMAHYSVAMPRGVGYHTCKDGAAWLAPPSVVPGADGKSGNHRGGRSFVGCQRPGRGNEAPRCRGSQRTYGGERGAQSWLERPRRFINPGRGRVLDPTRSRADGTAGGGRNPPSRPAPGPASASSSTAFCPSRYGMILRRKNF